MKRLLLILLLLAGCGQDENKSVDISMTEIVWQGQVADDSVLQKEFDATLACLEPLHSSLKSGSPYIVVLNSGFVCFDLFINIGGCTVFDDNTIYLTYDSEYVAFPHEVIHWATNLEDPAPKTPPLDQCEKIYNDIFPTYLSFFWKN